METEYNFLFGKGNQLPGEKTLREKRWLEVSKELNGLLLGCEKEPKEWRTCFANMRFKVAEKLKQIRLQPLSSGGGSQTNVVTLTDMDRSIIHIVEMGNSTSTLKCMRPYIPIPEDR